MYRGTTTSAPLVTLTTEMFIPTVMRRMVCDNHGAFYQEPCWQMENEQGKTFDAVCSNRAARAGYFGDISERALMSTSKKPNGR